MWWIYCKMRRKGRRRERLTYLHPSFPVWEKPHTLRVEAWSLYWTRVAWTSSWEQFSPEWGARSAALHHSHFSWLTSFPPRPKANTQVHDKWPHSPRIILSLATIAYTQIVSRRPQGGMQMQEGKVVHPLGEWASNPANVPLNFNEQLHFGAPIICQKPRQIWSHTFSHVDR